MIRAASRLAPALLLASCSATSVGLQSAGVDVLTAGDEPAAPTPSSSKEAQEDEAGAGPDERAEPPQLRASSRQADWGLAAVVRTAEIPFVGDNDSVSSFVPMMFYEGERWFLRGTAGGAHLWERDGLEVNALARLRFFDIPSEYQNSVQGDTVDFGLQVQKSVGATWGNAEVLSDDRGNWHANLRLGATLLEEDWIVAPALRVSYGSSDFVSRYYAVEPLTGQSADGGFVVSPEITARYHLLSDLYLVGTLRYNMFGSEIRGLDAIDRPGSYEALVGFGFFQDRGSPQFAGQPWERATTGREIETPPYFRVAHGWATESDLGEILGGDFEVEEYDNQLTSLFYGHPLTDELFGLPLQVYVSPGFAYHHSSEVQDETFELVAKIHAYFTIPWPIRWRLGVAEGVSWIDEVTYIENENMESKGYRPSQLMNYLDFTLDFNLGDVFGGDFLEHVWVGGSIHHRSSIFESASQFGRISGGSNYPSLYVQYDVY